MGCVNCFSAVKGWYDEIVNYDFLTGTKVPLPGAGEILHFTQVIWRNSSMLGVGVASGNGQGVYVVARYKAPGNFGGPQNFKLNVPAAQPLGLYIFIFFLVFVGVLKSSSV